MFLPPFFVLCHTPYPFLPAALFDLHGVFAALVRSTALRSVLALLLRRVSSPVMGIQLSRCFFGFVTVFFIDNPQSPC